MSADDTILVVKLKILEKLEIEPNEQVPATVHSLCSDLESRVQLTLNHSIIPKALFFNDVELKDSKATLRQFKVPAKATIFIERRQLSMADYDILDGHDQIEEGFKGMTPCSLLSPTSFLYVANFAFPTQAPSFRTKRRRTHQAGRRRAPLQRLFPRLRAEQRLRTCPRRSRTCGPAMCVPSTTRTLPPAAVSLRVIALFNTVMCSLRDGAILCEMCESPRT